VETRGNDAGIAARRQSRAMSRLLVGVPTTADSFALFVLRCPSCSSCSAFVLVLAKQMHPGDFNSNRVHPRSKNGNRVHLGSKNSNRVHLRPNNSNQVHLDD